MRTTQDLLDRLDRLAVTKKDRQCPAPVLIRQLEKCLLSLPQAMFDKELTILRSLSDPTRLKIIHLLSEKRDLCVCEVQVAIRESQPLTSHHLRELRKAGLVRSSHSGTWVHYSLASDKLTLILSTLRELAQDSTEGIEQERLGGR